MSASETVNHDPESNQQSGGKFLRFCQWIGFSVVLLVVASTAAVGALMDVPGAPVAAYSIAMLAGVTLLIIHATPMFFRLSKVLKKAAYIAVPIYIGFGLYVISEANLAYENTPKGRALAKERDASAAVRIVVEAEDRQQAQVAAATLEKQKEKEDKKQQVASCFGLFGNRIATFEEAVKDSLHNPSSFEHMETTTIEPDAEGNNVAMIFRGENGYGGIRTAAILAKINPDGCLVEKIGQAEIM